MDKSIRRLAVWVVVALALSIFMVTFNNSSMVVTAGFFTKSASVVIGTLLGTLGAIAGDGIRRFSMPSGFFTTGGITSIIWMRLFWKIGPQIIGVVAGSIFGATFILNKAVSNSEMSSVEREYITGCVTGGGSRGQCECIFSGIKLEFSESDLRQIEISGRLPPSFYEVMQQSAMMCREGKDPRQERFRSMLEEQFNNQAGNNTYEIKSCVDQRILAYRNEVGEDRIVRQDMLEEWRYECSSSSSGS